MGIHCWISGQAIVILIRQREMERVDTRASRADRSHLGPASRSRKNVTHQIMNMIRKGPSQGEAGSSMCGISSKCDGMTFFREHLKTETCCDVALLHHGWRDPLARGKVNQKVEPCPGVLATPTCPWCCSMRAFAIASPNPRPPCGPQCLGVAP